jgi:hypothetical protein
MIRALSDKRLCPLYRFRIFEQRARALGVADSLFCSDCRERYITNDTTRKGITSVMHEQGISKLSTGNTVRHETINACVGIMKMTRGVNAYTGHSNKATTAVATL